MPSSKKLGRPPRAVKAAPLNINLDPELIAEIRELSVTRQQTLRIVVEELLAAGLRVERFKNPE